MKNPLWSAIYDIFQELDSLLSRAERFQGIEGGNARACLIEIETRIGKANPAFRRTDRKGHRKTLVPQAASTSRYSSKMLASKIAGSSASMVTMTPAASRSPSGWTTAGA